MDKKIREEQIEFIQKVKSFLQPPSVQFDQENTIADLLQRIERLEKALEGEQEIETPRKSNVKNKIIFLLRQHKRLSSSQLSKLLGLSRTRCNEYFRELTKKGITEGTIIDRKKYYKLVKE